MLIVADRDEVTVFVGYEKLIVPLPVPLPEVMLSQLPGLEALAFQEQPDCVVTDTDPVPAVWGTVCDDGASA